MQIRRKVSTPIRWISTWPSGKPISTPGTILPWIVPGVLIGFPLGHVLIQRIGVETFRRICMSFDAYIVAFGLSRTLESAGVPPVAAYQVMIAASILDTALLWVFFRRRQPGPPRVDPTAL